MTVWIFVLSLMLPSFGGQVDMTFAFRDQDGCQRFRHTLERTLRTEFSIDVSPGNVKGHAMRPETGCEAR